MKNSFYLFVFALMIVVIGCDYSIEGDPNTDEFVGPGELAEKTMAGFHGIPTDDLSIEKGMEVALFTPNEKLW